MLGSQPAQLARDPAALVVLIARSIQPYLLALGALGEEVLRVTTGVFRDDGIRGVEDRLGRAEVLLEHDHLGVGESLFELQNVAHVGRAKAVDGLVRVAHHAEVAMFGREHHHQFVLHAVGVLELIDQKVLKAHLVGLEHPSVLAHHQHGVHQEVVEVHGVRGAQSLRVGEEHLGDAATLGVVPEGVEIRLGREHLVLRRGDRRRDAPWAEPLGVEVEFLHDPLDRRLGVAGVVDGEAPLVAEHVGVGAQHAKARRVKRGHPHRTSVLAHQLHHAPSHLVGRLVGEGDGHDLVGPSVPGREQVRDSPRQDPRLTRARTGDHQQRSSALHDRRALGRGESF